MKIFYVILTYNCPTLLGRTLRNLAGPDNWFYIHVDKRVDTAPFREQTTGIPQVRFLDDAERIESKWGHISTVEATLKAIRKINNEHPHDKDGYIVLFSGQDYPIRSRGYIQQFLKTHARHTYMQTEKVPYANLSEGGVNRTRDTYFHLGGRNIQRIKHLQIDKENTVSFCKILRYRPFQIFGALRAFFVPRKYPFDNLPPYVGEFWSSFPITVGRLLLDFNDRNPKYAHFHRHTLIPEECFFQTIIANKRDQLPGPLAGGSLRYVDWSNPHTPATFTIEHRGDIQHMMETEPAMLFARKFDDSTPEGREILDYIDTQIR